MDTASFCNVAVSNSDKMEINGVSNERTRHDTDLYERVINILEACLGSLGINLRGVMIAFRGSIRLAHAVQSGKACRGEYGNQSLCARGFTDL